MEVLVEHDYTAKEPNELSITKGDIIKDVVKKQTGWFEGILKDRKGVFPDVCVKIIEKDTIGVALRNRKDVARIRQCRVVYSYKQEHEDELNLNVGDIIEILGEEEEGWWRGLLNGKEGVFPSNFVEEIQQTTTKLKLNSRENPTIDSNDETPNLPARPQKIICEVKYPYKAQNDDELTLKEGDLVTLLSKDGQDPGWWKGELNGVIGVFPDNFVVVLPANVNEEKTPPHQPLPPPSSSQIIKEEKRPKTEPISIKPSSSNSNSSSILSQRKSLENQINEKHESEIITKTTPPIPGKKPIIPLKKSPSSTNSSNSNSSTNSINSGGGGGGIFHGLKKKIVDAVDGATGSKTITPPKTEMSNHESSSENVFDDVQRRPLLSDVRASRPKAPGRRLPSGIYKEGDFSGMMNGNTDHNQIMDSIQSTPPQPPLSNLSSSPPEQDTVDNKPKLREWEKHKAPWLEEMKLNQAKRTSTSPGPPEHKLKLTPTERSIDSSSSSSTTTTATVDEKNKQLEKDTNLIGHKLKTPPNELERTSIIRNKPNVPIATRPQTIHNMSPTTTTTSATINESTTTTTKPSTPLHPRISPLLTKTPSPLQQNDSRHNIELLIERINKLEELVRKQNRDIDELKGKLQIETEMRMELQAKFENYIDYSTIQQL